MMLERVGRDIYLRRIGLIADDGRLIEHGLANLIRSPLARWGLSPKASVVSYARRHLDAAATLTRSSDLVASVLGRMVKLGECVEVSVGGDIYVAPTSPRWIRTGKGIGTLLSVASVPEGIVEHVYRGRDGDIVRRIVVRTEEDQEILRLAGVSEISIQDWLTPLHYLMHGARRNGTPIRSDALNLSRFWEMLVSEVEAEARPLSDQADVRAVAGEPGTYFGSYNADNCEGRWRDDVGDGIWCAYRRGYGKPHWHPIILLVEGTLRRAMDIYDTDEWRWALLARGHHHKLPERVDRTDGRIQLTFPAPAQFIGAMDILGPRHHTWSWEVDSDAPDPWKEIY